MFSVRDFSDRAMALRKLCKDTKKLPLKALFFFPDENLTGIAPTKLIVKKDSDLTVGMMVKVNWQGKRVRAEILALNGKFTCHNFLKRFLHLFHRSVYFVST